MKKRHAVYAGTFDPVTKGHLWVVKEATRLFDHLTVAVTVNPGKTTNLFSIEERVSLFKEAVAEYSHVEVVSFTGMYTVQFAACIGASFMVRGVRNGHDFDEENLISKVNHSINPEISSVLISAPYDIADVSSSLVKKLIGPTGWEEVVQGYVPPGVFDAIKRKVSEN